MEWNEYIYDFSQITKTEYLLCDYSMLPRFYKCHKNFIPSELYKYLPMDADYYWNTLFNEQAWFSLALHDMNIFADKEDSMLDYDIENLNDVKNLRKSMNLLEDSCAILWELLLINKLFYKKSVKPRNLLEYQKYSVELAREDIKFNIDVINHTLEILNQTNCLDEFKNCYKRIIKNSLETELKRIGILSLTKTFENDYMWKQYAANYCGICIEYDSQSFPIPIFPILYRKHGHASLTEIFGTDNISLQDLQQKGYIRFLLKDKFDFEIEQEWRGLAAIDKCSDFSSIPLRGFVVDGFKPTKIYLGHNMNEANKKQIYDFCSKIHIPAREYEEKHR